MWPKAGATLSNLRLALRRGDQPQLVVTTTPKPIAVLRKLRAEPGCITTHAPTALNAAHLSPAFLDHVRALYGGTRLERQELEGLMVESEGALFNPETFARARGPVPAKLDCVVVAVDPPAGRNGSACGIVVVARGSGLGAGGSGKAAPSSLPNPQSPIPNPDCAFILEDCSAHGLSPLGWATRVAEAARRWNAWHIVAEANQGGEMVRSVLRQAEPPCPIRLVHASEGKRARAEPVALLYEQGRVIHCGAFGKLEEELLALGAEDSAEPTDRADAAIWALTDLLVTRRAEPRVRML